MSVLVYIHTGGRVTLWSRTFSVTVPAVHAKLLQMPLLRAVSLSVNGGLVAARIHRPRHSEKE